MFEKKQQTFVADDTFFDNMREIVHLQAGQCGNQIGAKVEKKFQFAKCVNYNFFWKSCFRHEGKKNVADVVTVNHSIVVLGGDK